MPEYVFNPATGQGEAVGGRAENTEQNYQELSDFWGEHTRAETAKHLAERRTHASSGEVQGTAADLALFAKQAELQQAQDAGDHVRAQLLQQEVMQLAQSAVAADVPDANDDREIAEVGDIHEARAQLRNDPAVESAMEWASEALDESTLTAIQRGLASENDELLSYTVENLKATHDAADTFVQVTDVSEMGGLSDSQISWFAEEYSPEIAQGIQALNYGIREKGMSFADAFKAAARSGLVGPMMRASKELEGFNVGIGF